MSPGGWLGSPATVAFRPQCKQPASAGREGVRHKGSSPSKRGGPCLGHHWPRPCLLLHHTTKLQRKPAIWAHLNVGFQNKHPALPKAKSSVLTSAQTHTALPWTSFQPWNRSAPESGMLTCPQAHARCRGGRLAELHRQH